MSLRVLHYLRNPQLDEPHPNVTEDHPVGALSRVLSQMDLTDLYCNEHELEEGELQPLVLPEESARDSLNASQEMFAQVEISFNEYGNYSNKMLECVAEMDRIVRGCLEREVHYLREQKRMNEEQEKLRDRITFLQSEFLRVNVENSQLIDKRRSLRTSREMPYGRKKECARRQARHTQ